MAMRKKIVLFGARHWLADNVPNDISDVLKYVIRRTRPAIGLEEWCAPELKRVSAFNACCDAASPRVPWKNVGTPDDPEFATDKGRMGNQFYILRYGPFDVQERRELFMRESILAVMVRFESAVLVIGEAHLHSMGTKLNTDFDVEAYGYFPPPPLAARKPPVNQS
jgi:hypothetical protein